MFFCHFLLLPYSPSLPLTKHFLDKMSYNERSRTRVVRSIILDTVSVKKYFFLPCDLLCFLCQIVDLLVFFFLSSRENKKDVCFRSLVYHCTTFTTLIFQNEHLSNLLCTFQLEMETVLPT